MPILTTADLLLRIESDAYLPWIPSADARYTGQCGHGRPAHRVPAQARPGPHPGTGAAAGTRGRAGRYLRGPAAPRPQPALGSAPGARRRAGLLGDPAWPAPRPARNHLAVHTEDHPMVRRV